MRRDPAGIAATDFNGSGGPAENGRTEIWNVPRVALSVQPSGTAAAAEPVASNTVIRIRITILKTRRARQKSTAHNTLHPRSRSRHNSPSFFMDITLPPRSQSRSDRIQTSSGEQANEMWRFPAAGFSTHTASGVVVTNVVPAIYNNQLAQSPAYQTYALLAFRPKWTGRNWRLAGSILV